MTSLRYNTSGKKIPIYSQVWHYYDNAQGHKQRELVLGSRIGYIVPGEMYADKGNTGNMGETKVGFYASGGYTYGVGLTSSMKSASAFGSNTRLSRYHRAKERKYYDVFTLRKSAQLYASNGKTKVKKLQSGDDIYLLKSYPATANFAKPWLMKIVGYRKKGKSAKTFKTYYLDTGFFEGMTTQSSCRIKTKR